jgi:hypothetical protein
MPINPGDSEARSQDERAESVSRQLSGEDAPEDTEQPTGTTEGRERRPAPDGVGESTTRSGERVVQQEGKEAGRRDTGTDDSPAQRPTGTSSPRDMTGVDPQDGPT